MKAEILATGDEVVTGAVVDSNSAFIAEKLEESGIDVTRHSCVKDDMDMLASVLEEIGGRSDIAVVSGGLGPTTDDITAAAAAKAAGVTTALDIEAQKTMAGYFKGRGIDMPTSNNKQAMLPEGSKCIANPVGTAPGFVLTIGKCNCFFVPGVPYEMRKMIVDAVLPQIETLQGSDRKIIRTKTMPLFGLAESVVSEKLEGFAACFPGVRLGFRPVFPIIHVKLYISGDNVLEVGKLLSKATEWIMDRLEKWIVSDTDETLEAVVGRLLIDNSATVAVAESCTGGLISSMLTDVPGSSDYFLFSGVTYSNQAKMDVLGVRPDTLEEFGAVHEETVKQMAEGTRRIAGATYGIATSGIAGPDGGTDEKPVGTVCIGIAGPDGSKGKRYHFPFPKRSMNKKIFAMAAIELLRREILGLSSE